MQNDGFIAKIAECYIKYLPNTTEVPLDWKLWNKILFVGGTLYDFAKGEFRPVRADDRMRNHTARPYVDWIAPDFVKQAVTDFAANVKLFFIGGGTDFDPIIAQDDPRNFSESSEVKGLRKECLRLWKFILDAPQSRMLRALAHLLAKDETDINEIVFVLRNDARTCASVQHLIGMFALTGPKNSGKTWIEKRLAKFLSYNPGGYAVQISGNYLSNKMREDRTPPLRGFMKGKGGGVGYFQSLLKLEIGGSS